MRHALVSALVAVGLTAGTTAPSFALPICLDGQRKVEEASALRYQARQEARLGDRQRVCDTLDEVGDRYNEARDAFEDCGRDIAAIDLRSALRGLRVAKEVNLCG